MSLITTSSQNKAYLLKTADCPRPRSEDNRDPAWICARTHLLLQAGAAGWLPYKHLSLDRLQQRRSLKRIIFRSSNFFYSLLYIQVGKLIVTRYFTF